MLSYIENNFHSLMPTKLMDLDDLVDGAYTFNSSSAFVEYIKDRVNKSIRQKFIKETLIELVDSVWNNTPSLNKTIDKIKDDGYIVQIGDSLNNKLWKIEQEYPTMANNIRLNFGEILSAVYICKRFKVKKISFPKDANRSLYDFFIDIFPVSAKYKQGAKPSVASLIHEAAYIERTQQKRILDIMMQSNNKKISDAKTAWDALIYLAFINSIDCSFHLYEIYKDYIDDLYITPLIKKIFNIALKASHEKLDIAYKKLHSSRVETEINTKERDLCVTAKPIGQFLKTIDMNKLIKDFCSFIETFANGVDTDKIATNIEDMYNNNFSDASVKLAILNPIKYVIYKKLLPTLSTKASKDINNFFNYIQLRQIHMIFDYEENGSISFNLIRAIDKKIVFSFKDSTSTNKGKITFGLI